MENRNPLLTIYVDRKYGEGQHTGPFLILLTIAYASATLSKKVIGGGRGLSYGDVRFIVTIELNE